MKGIGQTRALTSHAAAILIVCACFGSADASTLVPQTALPGDCIPQFAVPVPVFGPAGQTPRVDAARHTTLTVTMKEVDQAVLPQGITVSCPQLAPPAQVTFGKTRVWGYEISDARTNKLLGPARWPGVTIETSRHKPTQVNY